MHNFKLVTLMILMGLCAQTSFATSMASRAGQTVTNTTYDSTSMSKKTTTARLFCYQYTMNGQPVTNTAASNAPSSYDPARCVRLPYQGIVAIVGMIGGGNLGISCPSDHPYFRDRREWWAMVGPASSIAGGSDAECCALPDYTASGTAAWITPDNPGVCP